VDRAVPRCAAFLHGAIRTILAESKQMTLWRSQPFQTAAKKDGREDQVVKNATKIATHLIRKSPGVEPILSLRHLGHLTGTPYNMLRSVVRRDEPEPYRIFRIRKRPLANEKLRFRTIVVPAQWLMELQRWLNVCILEHISPHSASMAFSRGNSIRDAAAPHCGARWLIKMDIMNFFESVTERQVFRVFEDIGYEPLVAFELARLCTRLGTRSTHAGHPRYRSSLNWMEIKDYSDPLMGQLPQGAPTSPRLANLVSRDLDKALTKLADERGFVYTRYADDLTFSSREALNRTAIKPIIGAISGIIGDNGFSPNVAKTTVSSPGARKIVLGLLIDGDEPRLSREFKQKLRQHLYYLREHGPVIHAGRNGNATTFGLRRHVFGLLQHARQIEPVYGNSCLEEFAKIQW
jgi:retron-type reverse transcriptase